MQTKLTARTRRAIAKYGEQDCRRANELHEQGWGAAGIATSGPGMSGRVRTTRQADAAIAAGRELAGLPPAVRPEELERARAFWAGVARKHGWYAEPFHVQVWVDASGAVVDSVSVKGMPQDYIVPDTDR